MFAPRLQSKNFLYKLDLHKDGKEDAGEEKKLVRAVKLLITFETELFSAGDKARWAIKSLMQSLFNDSVQDELKAPVRQRGDF